MSIKTPGNFNLDAGHVEAAMNMLQLSNRAFVEANATNTPNYALWHVLQNTYRLFRIKKWCIIRYLKLTLSIWLSWCSCKIRENHEVFVFVGDCFVLKWRREAHGSTEAVCLRSIGFCFGELGDLEEAHDMRAKKYQRIDVCLYCMHSWQTCNSRLHDVYTICVVHLNLVKWVDHDCSCVSSWVMSGRHHLTQQSSVHRPWNTTVQPKPFLNPRNLLGHQLMQDGSWVENGMKRCNDIKWHGRGKEKLRKSKPEKLQWRNISWVMKTVRNDSSLESFGSETRILKLSLCGLVIVKLVF